MLGRGDAPRGSARGGRVLGDVPRAGDEAVPDEPAPPSALATLPLVKWATRLRRGTVEVWGRVVNDCTFPLGDRVLALPAGPIRVHAAWVGGESPRIVRCEVEGDGLRLDGEVGRLVAGTDDTLTLDDRELPVAERHRLARLMEAMMAAVGDVRVEARAEPDGELLLQVGLGVRVTIPPGVMLTVTGASVGPPDQLQLCEPLNVGFGGEGLRLTHDQFRWLARLAAIRLQRATLNPDGTIDLEGRAARGVDMAVRAPLQRVSAGLSHLVRHSPKFKRVRSFLKHAGPP